MAISTDFSAKNGDCLENQLSDFLYSTMAVFILILKRHLFLQFWGKKIIFGIIISTPDF
jgi:hypothetical protein